MAAIACGVKWFAVDNPSLTDGCWCCGWRWLTPSSAAFFEILRCMRGLRISARKSIPPGVYVNGFLSLVIMAFWMAAGGM